MGVTKERFRVAREGGILYSNYQIFICIRNSLNLYQYSVSIGIVCMYILYIYKLRFLHYLFNLLYSKFNLMSSQNIWKLYFLS